MFKNLFSRRKTEAHTIDLSKVKSAEIIATVRRADGTIEELGVVSRMGDPQ